MLLLGDVLNVVILLHDLVLRVSLGREDVELHAVVVGELYFKILLVDNIYRYML